MNRSTSLGNHASMAAEVVDRRKIVYKSALFENREDFDHEWTEFRSLCGSDTTSVSAWNLFQKVMKVKYDDEDEFANALFIALANALGNKCCHINSSKEIIIFEGQRSWGFARQAHRKKNVDSGGSATFAHDDHDCWHDHSCVLFKDSTELTVAEVTSVVELKMSDTSCYPIEITTRSDGEKWTTNKEPDLTKDYRPFAQALMYNIVDVLPGHVRNNVQPKKLPVTVLAGKRNGGKGIQEKVSFVQGYLHVPESFGGRFCYSISRYGSFKDHKGAIVAYLNTLCFGVRSAVRALELRWNVPIAMLCSSRHRIDQHDIFNCKLTGSPVFHTRRFHTMDGPCMSQGELFETVLTAQFFQKLRKSAGTLWIWKPLEHDESYNVCIKVASCSVHSLLVSSSATRATFRGLNCPELSEVLLCVWSESESGVVTIMRDLKKDQYQSLKPCSFPQLDAL